MPLTGVTPAQDLQDGQEGQEGQDFRGASDPSNSWTGFQDLQDSQDSPGAFPNAVAVVQRRDRQWVMRLPTLLCILFILFILSIESGLLSEPDTARPGTPRASVTQRHEDQ